MLTLSLQKRPGIHSLCLTLFRAFYATGRMQKPEKGTVEGVEAAILWPNVAASMTLTVPAPVPSKRCREHCSLTLEPEAALRQVLEKLGGNSDVRQLLLIPRVNDVELHFQGSIISTVGLVSLMDRRYQAPCSGILALGIPAAMMHAGKGTSMIGPVASHGAPIWWPLQVAEIMYCRYLYSEEAATTSLPL